MKHSFVAGLVGGLIGAAMLLFILGATGLAGAQARSSAALEPKRNPTTTISQTSTLSPTESSLVQSISNGATAPALSVSGSIVAQPASNVSRPQQVGAATPLTSTFTYQGQLKSGSVGVTGSCQMAFRLGDSPMGGSVIGSPITTTVPVANGLFTVGLDFGSSAFNGDGRWLDIRVNCGSGFVTLTPRQALTAVPYALFSTAPWATNDYGIVYSSTVGNVGIGTITPTYKLDVLHGGSTGLHVASRASFSVIDIDAASGDAALRFQRAGVGEWNIRNRPADDYLEIFELGGGGSRVVIQDGTGNVGIGETVAPSYKLDVLHGGATGIRSRSSSSFSLIDIDAANGDASLRFAKAGVNQWNIRNDPANDNLQIFELGGGGERLRIENGTGNVVIGGGVTTTYKLDVDGTVHASGGFNGQCLTNASNAFATNTTRTCNQDVAESFGSSEQTEPGDLVTLVTDDTATPTVRKSSQPYEGLLVGVVSQNPGLIFDNGQTNLAGDNSNLITADKTVIALVGRVDVKVSMENGFIAKGDPLTSSSTPGVAMKATRAGHIIGYAMENVQTNGVVLTLVQPGTYLPADQLAAQADPAPAFNLFNLLSVLAISGVVVVLIQQRKRQGGQA